MGISGQVPAPVVNAAVGAFQVGQGGTLVTTGLSVVDNALLSSTSNIQTTLAVNDGTLAISTSVTGGVTASQVTGSGTSSVTITASLAAVNATLADANGVT